MCGLLGEIRLEITLYKIKFEWPSCRIRLESETEMIRANEKEVHMHMLIIKRCQRLTMSANEELRGGD